MKFSEKLLSVAGKRPYSWALRNGVQKGTMRSWLNTEHPQGKSLKKLEELTGIPVDWWLHGSWPPPGTPSAQPPGSDPKEDDSSGPTIKVQEGPVLPPQEVRRAQGKINVPALAAIIEGALKTAPNAQPAALADHCAKIYAQAIEDGLITPDGLGPGRLDAAA